MKYPMYAKKNEAKFKKKKFNTQNWETTEEVKMNVAKVKSIRR